GSNSSTVVQCPAHIFINLSISGAGFAESPPACALASRISKSQTRSEEGAVMSEHRSSGFAGRVEKGKRGDFGGDGVANRFDGHFDVESGGDGGVVAADAGDGDHLLESGRPGGGSGFADLPATTIDRHGDARSHAGNLRRHADSLVEGFDFVPVNFEAD